MFEVKFPMVENVKAGIKLNKDGELVQTITFEGPLDEKSLARFLYLVRSNMSITCTFSTPQLQMDLLIQEIEKPVAKVSEPPKETKEEKKVVPTDTKPRDKDAFKSPVAAG